MNRYGEFVTYQWCPRGSGDRKDHERKQLVHRVIPQGFDADGLWRSELACMTVETAYALDKGQSLPVLWR